MDVCYLLLNGELPGKEEKADFEQTITYHTMVHEQLLYLYRGLRRDAHPMAVMVGVVGALSAFYHDSTDIKDPRQRSEEHKSELQSLIRIQYDVFCLTQKIIIFK